MKTGLNAVFLQKFAAVMGLFALSACGSLSGGSFGSSQSVNYAAGSALGAQLTSRDANTLSEAFLVALESGAAKNWSNGGARGTVEPGAYSIANLKGNPDIRIKARDGLDLTHQMETEQGLYVMTRNSNVRTGPSTERRIAEVLTSGTGVDVVGKIVGQPWMLIAADERIVGYVHVNLLIKAPGTELELAGGPRRIPKLCREFSQQLSVFGQSDEWQGAACQENDAWRLAPPEPVDAEDDGELLGL